MGSNGDSSFRLALHGGEAYLQAGRFDDAEAKLSEAVEREPASVPANLAAGHTAIARKDWSSATERFERAARGDPASSEAEIGWGRALAERQRIEQALWHFDRAAALNEEDPEPLFMAGALLFEQARTRGFESVGGRRALDEAESQLSSAAKHETTPVEAILTLGKVRQQRKAFRKALEAYEIAVKRDQDSLPARIGIAETAADLELYRQARRAIEPVLKPPTRDANDPVGVFLTARARAVLVMPLSRLRDWERGSAVICEAIEILDGLAADVPDLAEVCAFLTALLKVEDSGMLLHLGLFDEAVRRAEEGVQSGGGALPYALFALVTSHKERGDYKAMAEALKRTDALAAIGSLEQEDEDEDRAVVARLRALVLDAKGRPEEAYELLSSEIEALPDRLELRMELVQLLARERQAVGGVQAARWQHRLARAVDAARRSLAGRERKQSVVLSLSALEILGGTAYKARKRLTKAVEAEPDSYQVRALLGAAHARLGKDKDACESFAMAAQLAPHNLAYKLALATIHVRLGNLGAAESCYREVVARAPTNVEALVGLGSVLGTREEAEPDIYGEAAELLGRALDAASTMSGDLATQRGSIRLSRSRRAAIYHEIGVVRTRQFDAEADSNPLRRHPRLLRLARKAFARAIEEDDGMYLARRAMERIDSEHRTIGAERPKWALLAVIILLLGVLTSAFFVHAPHLHQLTGPTYSAMTLGLLVLLMATLYLDRLRTLRVAGVSIEKDVESPVLARKLGIEADPNIVELLQIPVESPPPPPPAGTEQTASESSQSAPQRSNVQATQGMTPDPGAQAATTAQHGARP
jgi:tetratricopeptide (TPR) repeat protein